MRGWPWLVLVIACEQPAKTAQFEATCQPDEAYAKVTCTIANRGKAPGRACVTVKLQPADGPLVYAQRACSAVIEPGTSKAIVPQFDRSVDISATCATLQPRAWTCKVGMLETPQSLGENIPPARKP